jgi:hypothetical protein
VISTRSAPEAPRAEQLPARTHIATDVGLASLVRLVAHRPPIASPVRPQTMIACNKRACGCRRCVIVSDQRLGAAGVRNLASMMLSVALRLAIDLAHSGVDAGVGCCRRMRLDSAPCPACRRVLTAAGGANLERAWSSCCAEPTSTDVNGPAVTCEFAVSAGQRGQRGVLAVKGSGVRIPSAPLLVPLSTDLVSAGQDAIASRP